MEDSRSVQEFQILGGHLAISNYWGGLPPQCLWWLRPWSDVWFLLVAGEEWAVLAFEELLSSVPVAVMSAQTLHVAGAELAELTGEDGVGPGLRSGTLERRIRRTGANIGLDSRRQLEVTQLLLNICWLQIPRRLWDDKDISAVTASASAVNICLGSYRHTESNHLLIVTLEHKTQSILGNWDLCIIWTLNK